MHSCPSFESIYIVVDYNLVDPIVLGDVVHLSLDLVAFVVQRYFCLRAISISNQPILNGFDVRGHHVDEMAIYVP